MSLIVLQSTAGVSYTYDADGNRVENLAALPACSIGMATPNSNLTVPENGPTTSGGAQQFHSKSPKSIPASSRKLELFMREWKYHHKLRLEQLPYADHETLVKEVGFYHGGDPIYTLEGIPGLWLEPCLRSA
jgi:hypothetical protein